MFVVVAAVAADDVLSFSFPFVVVVGCLYVACFFVCVLFLNLFFALFFFY